MSRSTTLEVGDDPGPAAGGRRARVAGFVGVGLVVLLVLLRLIHLGADTPAGVSTSDGLYVDEGYKTLSPRNLVLFGTTHWSPDDLYEGWMSISPITQWSYYAGFRMFGADVAAARSVTVAFFGVFLLGFVLAMRTRYDGPLLWVGVALLGLESTLYFLSRVAVFEVPIVTFFYGLLFVFAATRPGRMMAPLLWAVGIGVLLIFGIKVSALLYLAPVFCASSLFLVLHRGSPRPAARLGYAAATVLALGALLVLTREEWVFLLHIRPLEIGQRILDGPLVDRSPVVVFAGVLCAFHLFACRPDLCLTDLYRINLVFLALGGIPLIAVFEYDPLRYYVPLIPALLLVVLEWIHLRAWSFPPPRLRSPAGLATLAFLLIWSGFLIALAATKQPALLSGDDPGLLELAGAMVLALALWSFRALALRRLAVASAFVVLSTLFAIHDIRMLGSFLLRPTFEAERIRSDLVRLLPEDSILGGVWAPFLALGTPFKALYVAAEANKNARLPELAPDYVVLADPTGNSWNMVWSIRATPGMRLGSSVYTSTYNRKRVSVHPLLFEPGSAPSLRRGPYGIGRSLLRAGDPAAAEPELRAAVQVLEQDPGARETWVAEARSDWGACLTQLGRYADAERALLAAYEVFGPGGRAPAPVPARTTLERLAGLYRAWDRPEELARYRALAEQNRDNPAW